MTIASRGCAKAVEVNALDPSRTSCFGGDLAQLAFYQLPASRS
jgi:hypothetical protein